MIRQSLELDLKILLMSALTWGERFSFLVSKYRALAMLAAGREAKVAVRGNSVFVADVSSLGTLQSAITDFHDDVVKPRLFTNDAPTVIDVGANVGQFTNAVKLFYPQAVVHAFEPHPATYKALARNTARLVDVTVHNVGLGSEPGELPFYEHELSLMSSFQPYSDHEYGAADVVHLPVLRLDDVPDLPDSISLLKIDVEGFELNVLQGAAVTLGRSEHLLIEVSLGRTVQGGTNLDVLGHVKAGHPAATIVRTGRPLGIREAPTCEDFIIALNPSSEH